METLRLYALSFVGLPYKWGGDNPLTGFDCSGLIQELLASVGKDLPGDQTAQMLFDHFSKNGKWNHYACGSLAFFGKDALHITHVSMLIDQHRVVEATGQGMRISTIEEAKANNAVVRIRLLKDRKDLIAIIRPDYQPTIGEL